MTITLSITDQSPVRKGGTAADALRESVRLAQAAEGLGYARYWVAEHHNTGSFAGSCPDLLIGQIAASTRAIRVGSAGVMLSHYSALKVAEQFRILHAFHPGRIDLGIGRAPGTDPWTADALVYPRRKAPIQEFPRMVRDLLGYLHDRVEPGHPFEDVRAQPGPVPEELPEVWLLGSSDFSARLAAHLGLPFAFADFFGNTGEHGPRMAELYREEFRPSPYLQEPKLNVTLQVMCASTEEEARFLAASRNLNKARLVLGLGLGDGLLPPEEALAFPLDPEQLHYVNRGNTTYIDGDPGQVHDGILAAAERYGTSDIGVVTNCYSFEARVRSFRLVAEALGVAKASGTGS